MKKPSLIALVGISVLLIPLIMAHAATLTVNAGALQTWFLPVDIEPPATTDLYVEIRAYAGESGNLKEPPRTLGPYVLTGGADYYVAYDAQMRDCPASVTTTNKQVGGPFTASGDLTHILCVQRSQDGQVIIRAGAADGPIVDPTVISYGISSLVVQEGPPSPIVETGEASRAPEPTVEPEEAPAPATKPSEPGPTPEVSTVTEGSATETESDEPTATESYEPMGSESGEPTATPEAPQPCAWEVHEDDDGRTDLVETCPDDEASASAEGESAS